MWDELGFRTDLEVVAPLNTLPWPTPTGGQRHRGPCTSRRGCRTVAAANRLRKSFYRRVNIKNLDVCECVAGGRTHTPHSHLFSGAVHCFYRPPKLCHGDPRRGTSGRQPLWPPRLHTFATDAIAAELLAAMPQRQRSSNKSSELISVQVLFPFFFVL